MIAGLSGDEVPELLRRGEEILRQSRDKDFVFKNALGNIHLVPKDLLPTMDPAEGINLLRVHMTWPDKAKLDCDIDETDSDDGCGLPSATWDLSLTTLSDASYEPWVSIGAVHVGGAIVWKVRTSIPDDLFYELNIDDNPDRCFATLPQAIAAAEVALYHAVANYPRQTPSALDFAFGGTVWPGLAKLAEEKDEVGQVLAKLIQTGGDPHHWSGNMIEKLVEELPDLQAAIEVFIELNPVLHPHKQRMQHRFMEKCDRFRGWHFDTLAERQPQPAR